MEMGVGGTGDWKCEGVEVALFCRGAPKQTLMEGGKDSLMLALWQCSMSTSVGEVSSMPAGAFSLCECFVCCCCEGVGDERQCSVVTYGLPHQLTNAMDTPDVVSVVAASEMCAVDVLDQSLLSRKAGIWISKTQTWAFPDKNSMGSFVTVLYTIASLC